MLSPGLPFRLSYRTSITSAARYPRTTLPHLVAALAAFNSEHEASPCVKHRIANVVLLEGPLCRIPRQTTT